MHDTLKPSVTLVIGGARSGKSSHAEQLVCDLSPAPLYLATAEAFDDEMRNRIAMHRKQREGRFGRTVEEPLELARALRKLGAEDSAVLIDCVTVWLGNLMHHEGVKDSYRQIGELLAYLAQPRQRLVIVSNEVGQGIVPGDALSRHFRDQAGWLNQALAQRADRVVWMVAGIPVTIKGA